eukprot:gene41154-50210_t
MLTEEEAKKLTVSGLKEELKARGASISGKKQDLLDRLLEIIEQGNKNKKEDISGSNDEISNPNEKLDQVPTQHGDEVARPEIETNDGGNVPSTEDVPATLPAVETQPDVDASLPTVEAQVKSDDVDNVVEAAEQHVSAPPAVDEKLSGAQNKANLSKEEELKSKLLIKKAMADDSPSTHVRIDYFQRPLNLKAMIAWLSELLELEISLGSTWLNSIKTHCYVDFETVDQAKLCISRVVGKKYPSTSTALLQAHFTQVSAKEAANHPEAALKPGEWRKSGTKDSGKKPELPFAAPASLKRTIHQTLSSAGADVKDTGKINRPAPSTEQPDAQLRKTVFSPPVFWKPAPEEVVNRRKNLKQRLGK